MGNVTDNSVEKIKDCRLASINRNANGDYYVIFKLPNVKRGMHGKTKGRVNEVLIIGVPKNRIDEFLQNYYRRRDP